MVRSGHFGNNQFSLPLGCKTKRLPCERWVSSPTAELGAFLLSKLQSCQNNLRTVLRRQRPLAMARKNGAAPYPCDTFASGCTILNRLAAQVQLLAQQHHSSSQCAFIS